MQAGRERKSMHTFCAPRLCTENRASNMRTHVRTCIREHTYLHGQTRATYKNVHTHTSHSALVQNFSTGNCFFLRSNLDTTLIENSEQVRLIETFLFSVSCGCRVQRRFEDNFISKPMRMTPKLAKCTACIAVW